MKTIRNKFKKYLYTLEIAEYNDKYILSINVYDLLICQKQISIASDTI